MKINNILKTVSTVREKVIENYLKKEVEREKGMCIKLWPISLAGLPDRLIVFPDAKVFFVETKASGKEPRPLQLAMHRKLLRLGFKVKIIDSRFKVDQFIYEALYI